MKEQMKKEEKSYEVKRASRLWTVCKIEQNRFEFQIDAKRKEE